MSKRNSKMSSRYNSGPRRHFNQRNSNMKKIIDYVYESLEIQRYKYMLLGEENDLQLLNKNKYYVAPNYGGTNCLFVFLKIRDRYYSVLIDKKTLSYNKERNEIDKVKTIPVRVRLGKDLYKGTILDGTLLGSDKKVFIVNDIYRMQGNNLTNDNIKNKIINITSYLSVNSVQDDVLNNIEIHVNTVYELPKVRQLVYEDIPQVRYNDFVRGLLFLPEISNTRLIYLFKNDHDIVQPTESPKQKKNKLEFYLNKEIVLTFEMRQTGTPDVYKLYLLTRIKKNDKFIVKHKKIDIAYLPTNTDSKFCRDIFNDESEVLVKCRYVPDKKKWIPFELDETKTKPDKLRKLLEHSTSKKQR